MVSTRKKLKQSYKDINEAYSVLDAVKRKMYDREFFFQSEPTPINQESIHNFNKIMRNRILKHQNIMMKEPPLNIAIFVGLGLRQNQ